MNNAGAAGTVSFEIASPIPAAQDWNPTITEITMVRMPRTMRRMTAPFL
ncbi:MAG: hypothetical protein ACLUOF_12730 [Ruminococcus sp.]